MTMSDVHANQVNKSCSRSRGAARRGVRVGPAGGAADNDPQRTKRLRTSRARTARRDASSAAIGARN
jgi:hypothetical protein